MFCGDEAEKMFKLVSPSGEFQHVCEGCVVDFYGFVESGNADLVRAGRTDLAPSPNLNSNDYSKLISTLFSKNTENMAVQFEHNFNDFSKQFVNFPISQSDFFSKQRGAKSSKQTP
jgi:hypothetical protein